jgi:hypothetical protein
VERVEAQVDEMPHVNGLWIRGHHHTCPCLSKFAPSATRYFIPSEYVTRHKHRYEYINAGKTDEF